MRIAIICPVRQLTQADKGIIDLWVSKQEAKGHVVHLPYRDTDQSKGDIEKCNTNRSAVVLSDEVHVYYSELSQGVHFDLGMAFAFGKRIKLIPLYKQETNPYTFHGMLKQWEGNNE